MGKNRNRNCVKGVLLMDDGFTSWVRAIVNTDNMKVAETIATDNESVEVVKAFLDKVTKVNLDRNEVETVCRGILATEEFDSNRAKTNVTLDGFIGHLYTGTISINAFTNLINDLLMDVLADGLRSIPDAMIQYTTMTWVLVRTVLTELLSIVDNITARTKNGTVDDPATKKSQNNPKAVDIDLYPMTSEQEKRAKKLGIPFNNHLLNVDEYYRNEMKVVDDWKKSHSGFSSIEDIYGMSITEYKKWKRDVAVFINEVIASNDDAPTTTTELVASSNIGGTANTEPRHQKKEQSVYDLLESINDPIAFICWAKKNPSEVKSLKKIWLSNNKVISHIKAAESQCYDTNELKRFYRISGAVNHINLKAAFGAARLLAKKSGMSEKNAFMYVVPILSNDNDLIVDAIRCIGDEDIKRLKNGDANNVDLMLTVKHWIRRNLVNPVDVAGFPVSSSKDIHHNPQWELVGDMFDALEDALHAFATA